MFKVAQLIKDTKADFELRVLTLELLSLPPYHGAASLSVFLSFLHGAVGGSKDLKRVWWMSAWPTCEVSTFG